MAHVLLVQDDEDAVIIFRRALDKAGVVADLSVAPDADTALEALSRPQKPVDLVLLDLHLPGKSGLEVLEALDERHGPPVVVLTGTASPAEAEEARRRGAREVHQLPADLMSLTSLLRDVCRAHVHGA